MLYPLFTVNPDLILSVWGLQCLLSPTCTNIQCDCINPLYTGNPLTGTFANSEDPDEMQHYAAFH